MRTISETDVFPVCSLSGASIEFESMPITTRNISPHRSRSNSNHSEKDSVLSDFIFIPSSPSSISLYPSSNTSSGEILDEINDDRDYLNEFICPSDSEDELSYFSNNDNDDIFIEKHFSKQKLNYVHSLQDNQYQRSKHSNKKMKAQRQIKTKHAKTIKIKSHNKHLYINHRLAKKILLDQPSSHYIPSTEIIPLYSYEELRSIIYQHRHPFDSSYGYFSTPSKKNRQSKISQDTYLDESHIYAAYQYREYTLNEYNIPDEPTYDDAMINFLLEMQNRDLSPEDYEMLLRLDERVQRKTINTNVLDTLLTIDVDHKHLDEQCTICMEKYTLGQQIKLLPCKHIFHLDCIETYLKEFSNQCPLDNLPLI